MTKEISQQIAVDIDYLLTHSKDIKKEYLSCIPQWEKMFGVPYNEVASIAQFHALNIHHYTEQYYNNQDSFLN